MHMFGPNEHIAHKEEKHRIRTQKKHVATKHLEIRSQHNKLSTSPNYK